MYYTHGTLDRADHLRGQEETLLELRRSEKTRWIPVWNGDVLVRVPGEGTAPTLACLPARAELPMADPVFLGLVDKEPHFAIDCAGLDATGRAALIAQAVDHAGQRVAAEFSDLRIAGPQLPANEGALLAYARGMIFWQKNTRFCERCGAALTSIRGGHVHRCTDEACGYQAFPRTDPAVIMLVQHTDEQGIERCLLGGAPAWPSGVYSTLAGFVEPGESLEQAVQREVLEEARIRCDRVQYVASQPWPFPRSIMLGFVAHAINTDIVIDPTELARADWFTRDELEGFGYWGDERFERQLPRRDSIAALLINRWMRSELPA